MSTLSFEYQEKDHSITEMCPWKYLISTLVKNSKLANITSGYEELSTDKKQYILHQKRKPKN